MRVVALMTACALGACLPGWHQRDTIVVAALGMMLAADGLQTAQLVHHRCGKGVEGNPILMEPGKGGIGVPPSVYFTGLLAAEVAIAALVSDRWRPLVHGYALGVEGDAVVANVAAGCYP